MKKSCVPTNTKNSNSTTVADAPPNPSTPGIKSILSILDLERFTRKLFSSNPKLSIEATLILISASRGSGNWLTYSEISNECHIDRNLDTNTPSLNALRSLEAIETRVTRGADGRLKGQIRFIVTHADFIPLECDDGSLVLRIFDGLVQLRKSQRNISTLAALVLMGVYVRRLRDVPAISRFVYRRSEYKDYTVCNRIVRALSDTGLLETITTDSNKTGTQVFPIEDHL